MNRNEIICYIDDQARSREFWSALLGTAPILDVPGMTESDLGGVTLGLIPFADMAELVPGLRRGSGQRCEIYLRRPDAAALLDRLVAAGGALLAPLVPRGWGEVVGYGLDPDGHVVAIAQSPPADAEV